MSISHLIPVAVLVLVATAATPSIVRAAPSAARTSAASLDCVTVTIAAPGHEDDITVCPPDVPPFPPM